LVFNFRIVFGDSPPWDYRHCDGYLSLFLEFDSKTKKVSVDSFKFRSTSGCQHKLNEFKPNYEVKIFNINNVLISKGKLFLSEEVFNEKENKDAKLVRTIDLSNSKIYRLIKISFKTPLEQIARFRIYDLRTNRLRGEKLLNLN